MTRACVHVLIRRMFYDISFAASVSAAAYALRSTMLECHDCQDSLLALGSLVLTFVPMWYVHAAVPIGV